MRNYIVFVDTDARSLRTITVEAEDDFDPGAFNRVPFAGEPLVRIGEALISRDRIVAVVPEDSEILKGSPLMSKSGA